MVKINLRKITWKRLKKTKISPEKYIMGKLGLMGHRGLKSKWMEEGYLGYNWCVFADPKAIALAVKEYGRLPTVDVRYPTNCVSHWKDIDFNPDHVVNHIDYWLKMFEYDKFYKKCKEKK